MGRRKGVSTPYQLYEEKLSSPTHFGEIYEAADTRLHSGLGRTAQSSEIDFFILVLVRRQWPRCGSSLAKTRFPAELIESSIKHCVQTVSVPFDISAEFLPNLLLKPDEQLRSASAEKPIESASFANILYRSPIMAHLVKRAQRVALRDVPVLLEGESRHRQRAFCPRHSRS